MTGMFAVPLGVKNAGLVPLGMFGLKRSTVGIFAVPFRILNRKNMTEEII